MTDIDPAVIKLASDASDRHEPIGGGFWCSCQPVDSDGLRSPLAVTWDYHVAEVVLAVVLPVIEQQLRERIANEIDSLRGVLPSGSKIDPAVYHAALRVAARTVRWSLKDDS